MLLSVFTIESVALILVITKDSGTIARKTGSPFVLFISREISQATSSLTFSTRNSILETRDSILSRIENRVSRLEDRGSRDCQLTFERYCTWDVGKTLKKIVNHLPWARDFYTSQMSHHPKWVITAVTHRKMDILKVSSIYAS